MTGVAQKKEGKVTSKLFTEIKSFFQNVASFSPTFILVGKQSKTVALKNTFSRQTSSGLQYININYIYPK